jgi:hypothetical protein
MTEANSNFKALPILQSQQDAENIHINNQPD